MGSKHSKVLQVLRLKVAFGPWAFNFASHLKALCSDLAFPNTPSIHQQIPSLSSLMLSVVAAAVAPADFLLLLLMVSCCCFLLLTVCYCCCLFSCCGWGVFWFATGMLCIRHMFQGVKKRVEISQKRAPPKRANGRPGRQPRLEKAVAAQLPGIAGELEVLAKRTGQMDLEALQDAIEQLALVVETEQFWL